MIEQSAATQNLGTRTVQITRVEQGRYQVENARGGVLSFGTGEDSDFTPVELFLAAIAGCSAVDVDYLTTKRVEPESFTVAAQGDKMKDPEYGSFMDQLQLAFNLDFPDDEQGQRSAALAAQAVQKSLDRLCTVSRTVSGGVPVTATTVATVSAQV